MELRHLKYFVAVAEELSFTRAAQRLHVSQPPLSHQIRLLEEELDLALLIRDKRSVQLTDAGKVFLEEARATLLHSMRAKELAKRAASGYAGTLKIGFVPTADVLVIPKVYRVYSDAYPAVHLELFSMNDLRQREALLEGAISVGVTTMPTVDASATFEKFFEEEMVVALPSTHPLAREEAVDLADLAHEPYIIVDRRVAVTMHDHIIFICQKAGFSPKVVQQVDHVQFMLSLIASSVGLSLLPKRITMLPRQGVTFRPIVPPAPKVSLGLIYQLDNRPAIVDGFLDVVRVAFLGSTN